MPGAGPYYWRGNIPSCILSGGVVSESYAEEGDIGSSVDAGHNNC